MFVINLSKINLPLLGGGDNCLCFIRRMQRQSIKPVLIDNRYATEFQPLGQHGGQ